MDAVRHQSFVVLVNGVPSHRFIGATIYKLDFMNNEG